MNKWYMRILAKPKVLGTAECKIPRTQHWPTRGRCAGVLSSGHGSAGGSAGDFRKEHRGLAFILALGIHLLLLVFLLISVDWQTHHQPVEVELWNTSSLALQPNHEVRLEKQQPQKEEKQETDKIVEEALTQEPDIKEKAKKKEKILPYTASLPEKRIPTTKPIPPSQPKAIPKPHSKPETTPSEMSNILNQGLKMLNQSYFSTTSKSQRHAEKYHPNLHITGTGTGTDTGRGAGTGKANNAVSSYQSILANLIRSRNNYPDDKLGNPQAQFKLMIWPDGRIQDVILIKQYGDPAYAEASRRAILSLGQLPSPPPGVYFSQLNGMIISCKLKE